MGSKFVKWSIYFVCFFVFVPACYSEQLIFESINSNNGGVIDVGKAESVGSMSLDEAFNDKQLRALARAAGKGEIDKIEKLHDQGVNVNSQGEKGVTALFWALRNSNVRGFNKLLELGADPNIIFSGTSVMHRAAKHKDVQFLSQALINGGNPNLEAGWRNETPLFTTIMAGEIDRQQHMVALLNFGANVEAVTKGEIFGLPIGGKTPLIVAAEMVRYDIVYYLLEYGADYSVTDDKGNGLKEVMDLMEGRFDPSSKQKVYFENVKYWISKPVRSGSIDLDKNQ